MPEYLAPGVYVEEVSFRSKSIEGVPTSTTGFTGMTRYGPVHYPGPANHGPLPIEPRMMTSFPEFERMFGGLEALRTPADGDERVAYTSQAARAFFLNGGQRLYISRVFAPRGAAGAEDWGIASRSIPVSGTTATWRARWPGAYGNVLVETKVVRSKNIAFFSTQYGAVQVTRAKRGAIVEITPAGGTPPKANDPLVLGALAEIDIDLADGRQLFRRGAGTFAPAATDNIQLVELRVEVTVDPLERVDVYNELGASPSQRRYIGKILQLEDPQDEAAAVWLDWEPRTP